MVNRATINHGTTDQGHAAMEEFGFEAAAIGGATPGRIADRLSDACTALDSGIASGNWGAVIAASAELRRLRLAIDAWDACMLFNHTRPEGGKQ